MHPYGHIISFPVLYLYKNKVIFYINIELKYYKTINKASTEPNNSSIYLINSSCLFWMNPQIHENLPILSYLAGNNSFEIRGTYF